MDRIFIRDVQIVNPGGVGLMRGDLLLEDGRIAQQGTHEQLIRQEGLYQKVYRIQAALEDELRNEELGIGDQE